MNMNYTWNTSNRKETQEDIEKKITEWISQEIEFNTQALHISLSLHGPLDTNLSGSINDDKNKVICNFTSNEFLNPLVINYPLKE